jgi:hypothetical protein
MCRHQDQVSRTFSRGRYHSAPCSASWHPARHAHTSPSKLVLYTRQIETGGVQPLARGTAQLARGIVFAAAWVGTYQYDLRAESAGKRDGVRYGSLGVGSAVERHDDSLDRSKRIRSVRGTHLGRAGR